ncbi:hypothetical protein FEM48_Zijuj02G0009300 [Ziziphus jujuba var. spinosa]|uniref:Bulb-type lectin domain-containing protein n=1 Tax=Ziziphus jujuba var. spinosa TaxID=714518 RepID=A0A978VSN6_ZIZJJ|nr:hypothetical protein FEM48_Zijuj02G0009300 [Ziziphus jujuba var. spinosa]
MAPAVDIYGQFFFNSCLAAEKIVKLRAVILQKYSYAHSSKNPSSISNMDICIFFLLLLPSLFQALPYSLSATSDNHILEQGSSLSVEKQNDVLVSPNGVFSAGFSPVGDNAFCFSIRFMKSSVPTIVWMANRNQPVNGKASKLSLLRNGNLILLDAGRIPLWSTETTSPISVYLQLHDSGNLVLHNIKNESLWESFDSPTDTLLPGQKITKDASLLSSKSQTNYSSGYYTLYFDNDNVIRLLFQGPDPEISSVYWPEPNVRPFEAGRTTYNNSKTAMFNSTGYFQSSDDLVFSASDCGMVLHRRLTVDPDGNLRFYSFDEKNMEWVVTWQAFPQPCRIHGICGPNSLCKYDHALGRRCSCLPGFKMKSNLDWSYGCEPVGFNYNSLVNNSQESGFVHLASTEFYGYDKDFIQNTTLQKCKEKCLSSQCKAIQFKYSADDGYYNCYTKPQLLNGHQPYFQGDIYVRMPKSVLSSIKKSMKELWLNCPQDSNALLLNRTYEKEENHGRLVKWVKEKMIGADTSQTDWTEEVADSTMSGKFDKAKLEVLVKVALQCVEEDKEARPTMRQVVEMLQGYEEEKIFDTPKVPDASCESELPYFDNIGKFTDEENNSRTFLMGH